MVKAWALVYFDTGISRYLRDKYFDIVWGYHPRKPSKKDPKIFFPRLNLRCFFFLSVTLWSIKYIFWHCLKFQILLDGAEENIFSCFFSGKWKSSFENLIIQHALVVQWACFSRLVQNLFNFAILVLLRCCWSTNYFCVQNVWAISLFCFLVKWKKFFDKIEEATKNYEPCKENCTCYDSVLKEDFRVWKNRGEITKDDMKSAMKRGVHYQIFNHKLFRQDECMFPAR